MIINVIMSKIDYLFFLFFHHFLLSCHIKISHKIIIKNDVYNKFRIQFKINNNQLKWKKTLGSCFLNLLKNKFIQLHSVHHCIFFS